MDPCNIITDNLRHYGAIKPKNPDSSYTVLATLNDSTSGKLLALATGTQANLRVHSNDIEDCHAESLVKRAYKRYLINTIASIFARGTDSNDIDLSIKQECNRNLTLFISQFPCGHIRRYQGDQSIDDNGQIIKRKPGRGTVKNGKVVYVNKDNCLNKVTRWIKDGLQGKKLNEVFKIRGSIKFVIVGNCEPHDEFDYETSATSLGNYFRDLYQADAPQVQIFNNARRDEFVYGADKQPHPVSLVWWSSHSADPPNACDQTKRRKICHEFSHELIVDGRKRGLTKKQCMKGIPSNYLKVSNYALRADLGKIEQLYRSAKSGD